MGAPPGALLAGLDHRAAFGGTGVRHRRCSRPRGDARLLYVSLAFLSSAGFLGLHALATPGVLLGKPNTGFLIATPVGLAIGWVFAALSTADFPGDRAVRHVRIGKRLRLGAARPDGAVGGLVACVSCRRSTGRPQFAERFPLLARRPRGRCCTPSVRRATSSCGGVTPR